MYTLHYKTHFDAAHHLPEYKGKCSEVHGHRWIVEFEIRGNELRDGMLVDFSELNKVVDSLDHKDINKIIPNPTCELVATYLLYQVNKELKVPRSQMNITVYESPDASISYYTND